MYAHHNVGGQGDRHGCLTRFTDIYHKLRRQEKTDKYHGVPFDIGTHDLQAVALMDLHMNLNLISPLTSLPMADSGAYGFRHR
jgi:hypothetical protein